MAANFIIVTREINIMSEVTLTTDGTRTFGGVITVQWRPSTTQNSLTVNIDQGGSLLQSLIFDGSGTESFDTGQGTTITTQGTFTAIFGAGGTTGTLSAHEFCWDVNGQQGSFKGTIGIW